MPLQFAKMRWKMEECNGARCKKTKQKLLARAKEFACDPLAPLNDDSHQRFPETGELNTTIKLCNFKSLYIQVDTKLIGMYLMYNFGRDGIPKFKKIPDPE